MPTLPEEVARLLRGEIGSEALRPGDRLPTEQQLSARFDVSRAVVREAISRLKDEGLVNSHQGRGTFISPPAQRTTFRIEPCSLRDRNELSEIVELRITFEAGAAFLAAKRRKKVHLTQMLAALEAMVEAVRHDEDGVEADAAFHLAVAEATGNGYFKEFMSFLHARIYASIRAARYNLLRDKRRANIDIAEHRAIYDAIARRDPEAARHAVLAHLTNAARDLQLETRVATRRGDRSGSANRHCSMQGAVSRGRSTPAQKPTKGTGTPSRRRRGRKPSVRQPSH
jgi:DNA-binding FadR family transcriptional regulator